MADGHGAVAEELLGPLIIKPLDPAVTGLKHVVVINTGGTIGMKVNDEGSLEPSPGYLAERMAGMSEFTRDEMPAVSLWEMLPLIDSSDMGPADWQRIAGFIESHYYGADAFVLVMGTDTMAYAAAALSFMLENLDKPVVVTGSMLPLSDLFNDAYRNLIVSVVMAATLTVPEVCIFMDDQLMRGNRTVKMNSSGLDAFDSPNFPPLAKLETGIRFKSQLVLSPPMGRFRVHRDLETNIAVWRMIPGFGDEYIANSIKHAVSLRAIVLELYGTGNLSGRKGGLLELLEAALAKGIVIVACSQCLRGTVDLRAYALGRRLDSIGVISALDMTTEATCAKLAYLLSWPGITLDQLRLYMAKSLRGEVTESAAFGHGGGAAGGDTRITMESISGVFRRGGSTRSGVGSTSASPAAGQPLSAGSGATPDAGGAGATPRRQLGAAAAAMLARQGTVRFPTLGALAVVGGAGAPAAAVGATGTASPRGAS